MADEKESGAIDERGRTPVEFDLESYRFRNTHRSIGGIINTSFSLVGITTRQHALELETMVERRKQRIKDAVVSSIRSASLDELEDPELVMVQKRLLLVVNRVLGEPLLKEVLVTDFQCVIE